MSRITTANVVQRQGASIPNADLVAKGLSLLGPNKFAAFNGITCADGDYIALAVDVAAVPYRQVQETLAGWVYYWSASADEPAPMPTLRGTEVVANGGSGQAIGLLHPRATSASPGYGDGEPVFLILQATEAMNGGHAQVVG